MRAYAQMSVQAVYMLKLKLSQGYYIHIKPAMY
jgi:hypothetical protein